MRPSKKPPDPPDSGVIGDLLDRLPWVAGSDVSRRAEIASLFTYRHFQPGEVLCTFGEPGTSIFIVDEGVLEVFIEDSGGRRFHLEKIRTEGTVFGEVASLSGHGRRSATVIAVSELFALELLPEALDRYLELSPSGAKEMMRQMAVRLARLSKQLHVGYRDIEEVVDEQKDAQTLWVERLLRSFGSLTFLALNVGALLIWWIFADKEKFGMEAAGICLHIEATIVTIMVLNSESRSKKVDELRSNETSKRLKELNDRSEHLHKDIEEIRGRISGLK